LYSLFSVPKYFQGQSTTNRRTVKKKFSVALFFKSALISPWICCNWTEVRQRCSFNVCIQL